LLKVPRMGEKAFEQSAGFLRIHEGKNPLDQSAVHPEAYPVVEKIALDLGVDLKSLIGKEDLIKKVDVKKYISDTTGEHTIRDILNELRKPGLDPRTELEQFEFANIYKIEDVQVGMIVPGVVTNITRFGAFIDIGVKQDGLVHVSEIANRFITDPNEVLKLNDKVQVKVTEVDTVRKRIALSIKKASTPKTEGLKPKTSSEPKAQSLKPETKPEAGGGRPEISKEKNKKPDNSMEDALTALKMKFKML
jgi:protein Tex